MTTTDMVKNLFKLLGHNFTDWFSADWEDTIINIAREGA